MSNDICHNTYAFRGFGKSLIRVLVMKKLHIIFDMDGTLLDTEFETSSITAKLAHEMGWNISADEVFREHAGLGSKEKFISIAKVFGATPSDGELEFLSHEHERLKSEIYTRDVIPMMPNAKETLAALAETGATLSLGSSNPSTRSKSGLGKTGMISYFGDHIYGPDLTEGKKKPDPAVFLLGMKNENSAPADTVVIEDSEPGMQAGRAAGATVIALLDARFGTGKEAAAKAEAFRKVGADIIVRDLSEIPVEIAKLEAARAAAPVAKTAAAKLSP